jgi:hypothetical protein
MVFIEAIQAEEAIIASRAEPLSILVLTDNTLLDDREVNGLSFPKGFCPGTPHRREHIILLLSLVVSPVLNDHFGCLEKFLLTLVILLIFLFPHLLNLVLHFQSLHLFLPCFHPPERPLNESDCCDPSILLFVPHYWLQDPD